MKANGKKGYAFTVLVCITYSINALPEAEVVPDPTAVKEEGEVG